MSKQETVEVTLKLPKAVVDCIRALEGDPAKWIAHEIIELMVSYVECVNATQLMNKYGLKPVFKEHGVLPLYYNNQ